MRRFFMTLIALTLSLALVLGACAKPAPAPAPAPKPAPPPTPAPKPAAPLTLKLANMSPAAAPLTIHTWNDFQKEVERRTQGRVKVEMYPADVLGKGPEHYDMVVKGVVDMAFQIPGYTPGKFPLTSIASLPFAFPDALNASWVMHRLQTRGYFEKEFADVKLLSIGTPAPYLIWTTKKQVTKLEDVKGLAIRGWEEWMIKAQETLGMSAPLMALPEVYMALERGTLDGTLSPYSLADSFKFFEVAKFVAEFPVFTGAQTYIMNKDFFAKLSKEDQRIIEELAVEFGLRKPAVEDLFGRHLRSAAAKRGVTVFTPPPEELARWEKAVQPVWEEWVAAMEKKGLPGKQIMADFKKIREDIGLEWRP